MKAFKRADVLLPKEEYREAFAVVACDQYTSEPQYWEQVARLVGDSPSAYHIIVPESYLGRGGVEERIASVNGEMERYLESGVFEELSGCYIYVERTLRDGKVRRGLIGMIDLKEYDYNKGSQSLIRATEATVLERIPPRVAVREHAALESPHVMILFDDREDRVFSQIEPRRLQKLYDFPLMMDSGAVRGWKVDEDTASRLDQALDAFADPTAYAQKYGVPGSPLALAVGDGNHSLATAKECYRRLCEQHGEAAMEHHPARYALVELCNLHDPSLEFEPIHRVVFGVEPERFLAEMRRSLCGGGEAVQRFEVVHGKERETVEVARPGSNMEVGTVQEFIDGYLAQYGGRVDYIHGEEVAAGLARQPGNVAFLLPPIDKNELFKTVILDGALTRKTFSMGHACDKRFYLECRRIK
ncbi:DUF1015 domain-containing protein [Harryflintia acetispora]|uniref:DUF1015 domain-containing protein n=1 Tax=Harryflintia acetispora TaxID=1849041 RepID=UPI001897A10C|nr:DUF1015 domain-containing protein [Harryflintia acetispora]